MSIARDSYQYAKQVTEELTAKVDVLNRLPRIGRVVAEIGDENVITKRRRVSG
ncbi:MAG: hypothetical protein ACYDC8_06025 [Gammaproteobacteria bacterium]